MPDKNLKNAPGGVDIMWQGPTTNDQFGSSVEKKANINPSRDIKQPK